MNSFSMSRLLRESSGCSIVMVPLPNEGNTGRYRKSWQFFASVQSVDSILLTTHTYPHSYAIIIHIPYNYNKNHITPSLIYKTVRCMFSSSRKSLTHIQDEKTEQSIAWNILLITQLWLHSVPRCLGIRYVKKFYTVIFSHGYSLLKII